MFGHEYFWSRVRPEAPRPPRAIIKSKGFDLNPSCNCAHLKYFSSLGSTCSKDAEGTQTSAPLGLYVHSADRCVCKTISYT